MMKYLMLHFDAESIFKLRDAICVSFQCQSWKIKSFVYNVYPENNLFQKLAIRRI